MTRDDLFALAALPIGSAALFAKANGVRPGERIPEDVAETARRAQKPWLPAGKISANTKANRECEAALKALNYDLEDAVEAAGGKRGHCAV